MGFSILGGGSGLGDGILAFWPYVSNCWGRYGNMFCKSWVFGGSGCRCIWLYNLRWIVFGRDILSRYVLWNCVYGCGVSTCLSGGLGSFVIFSNNFEVQSRIGCCCRFMPQSLVEGLIVMIRAYISLGGGWLACCCM